jgi:hypothetical protein
MLDVHPPHERMHGFRDFALHLLTITIGLLIALSLEGCVEWRHHRNLRHEAEIGIRGEIDHNAKIILSLHQQIDAQEKELDSDLTVLDQMKAHPNAPHGQLGFSFRWSGFDDVAWKTAQSTGALAYMPYSEAAIYSNIYTLQNELFSAERDVTDEVLRSSAFPSTQPDSWVPTTAQADDLRTHIGLLRMRLLLLTSYLNGLERVYKNARADQS